MKKVLKNKILLLNWDLTQAKLSGDKKMIKNLKDDIQFYINSYKNLVQEDANRQRINERYTE